MIESLNQVMAKLQQLPESEQERIVQIILKELDSNEVDFWDELDNILEESKISTGIKDLSYQHDQKC